jgi:hypothetical protein
MIVFDKDLKGVCDHQNIESMDFCTFLESIKNYCLSENVRTVAYAARELDVFLEYGFDTTTLYIDAKQVIKKWFVRNRFGDRPRPFALNAVLQYLGYLEYQSFGNRQITQRIRRVRHQLVRRGQDYSSLTPTVKAKWTKVYKYNKQDVIGLLWALRETEIVA